MADEIQPIKSLDELETGDIVMINGNIYGLHIVTAIGDVPEHELEVVLHQIHCPETHDSEIDYHRTVLNNPLNIDGDIPLSITRMKKQDYAGYKYAGIKKVE